MNSTITDNILQNLTNLTSINLEYDNTISDDLIKRLTNLTSLNVDYNKKISSKGFMNLNLETLSLNGNKKGIIMVFKIDIE